MIKTAISRYNGLHAKLMLLLEDFIQKTALLSKETSKELSIGYEVINAAICSMLEHAIADQLEEGARSFESYMAIESLGDEFFDDKGSTDDDILH